MTRDILPFSGAQTSVASPAKSNVIGFGVYEFNVVTGELRKDGMRIRLEGQPLTILQMLLERPGELVTREELQKRLWPGETFVDFEHSLNAGIKRLRAALSDSAEQPRYIETQARRGYRFIAPLDGVVASAEAVAFAPPANGNNAVSLDPPAQPLRSAISHLSYQMDFRLGAGSSGSRAGDRRRPLASQHGVFLAKPDR